MNTDQAAKTQHCVRMMLAARVLAETAPDDFRKRIVARPVFSHVQAFLRWAPQVKNGLKKRKVDRALIHEIEVALKDLGERDFAHYEDVRHRIAAHRQAFVPLPQPELLADSEAWNDIDEAAVTILTDDATAIWNKLAPHTQLPKVSAPPELPEHVRLGIAERGYTGEQVAGVRIGTGSFDETRPDTVTITQGGALGQRQRQIIDTIHSIETTGQLTPLLEGDFQWITVTSGIVDLATLVDLCYEQPLNPMVQYAPLLELMRADGRSPALPLLERGYATLDRAAVVALRQLRNTVGAHIDDRRTMLQLEQDLRGFDVAGANRVLANISTTLAEASNDPAARLVHLKLFRGQMSDLRRVDRSELVKPYEVDAPPRSLARHGRQGPSDRPGD
jgi:hypothetical protein